MYPLAELMITVSLEIDTISFPAQPPGETDAHREIPTIISAGERCLFHVTSLLVL